MDFGLSPHITDDPSTWLHQDQSRPIRIASDGYAKFRSLSGALVSRGVEQSALQNERIYSK